MKQFYILLLFLIIISSCKKSSKTEEVPAPVTDILYTMQPSVLSKIGYDGPDVIQGYEFDLNRDSILDFAIFASGPLPGYPYESFWIFGLDSNKVMGIVNQQVYCPQNALLNANYLLDVASSNWTSVFKLEDITNYSSEINCQSGSSQYLGLYLKKNNLIYTGWICLDWDLSKKLLKVYGYAVHKTPELSIKTGLH